MLVHAPGYLFSVPGVVMAAVGVTIMTLALTGLRLENIGFGIHSMIAGSLLTIVGYQVASMGMFAAVAADLIKKPRDPITIRLAEQLRIEHGVMAGLTIFTLGVLYAAYMLARWIFSGYTALPFLMMDVAALTAVILGVQPTFGTFFFIAVSESA